MSIAADSAYALETDLAARDPSLRRRRGVYFTPREAVSYLVRSVDWLLHHELELAQGLATEGLRVVDPACGSAVFLREVLGECAGHNAGPTLIGFDVLPEACAAARNTLAECGKIDAACISELNPLAAEEATMAGMLRLSKMVGVVRRPLVILGNPPWANFGRQNKGSWIRGLMKEYTGGLGETKHNLADDYIKFIRWGQYWIDRAGAGILAFVTANTHLAGLTHRVMRRSLLESFDEIYIYNLHGSAAKRDRTSDGSPDENLFGVRSGVALNLLIKRGRHAERACYYAELSGTRESKLATLAKSDVATTRWTRFEPFAPMYYLVPRKNRFESQYDSWPRLDEIFSAYISGVQTKNDALYTAFTREELAERMKIHLTDGDVPFEENRVVQYLTAPFDVRWLYYEPRLLGRARYGVMRHMLRPNAGLVFMRQSTNPGEYDHFLVANTLVSDRVFQSVHGAPFLAPLYLYEDSNCVANLDGEIIERLETAWRWRYVGAGCGDLLASFGPEDVLHYLYAVVQGTEYRRNHDSDLRTDFPRVPIHENVALVRNLCELGRCLVGLHTSFNQKPTATAHLTSGAVAAGSGLNESRGFRLGGCEPVRRWLKQRKGRELSTSEEAHYKRLVELAGQTRRLRQEIDAALR